MVDKNQDSNTTPSGNDFPPLDVKPAGEASEEKPEPSESRVVEQAEKGTRPEEPSAKPAAKPEKQPPSFLLRSLRWILGILIVFGLGALTVVYIGLIPTQQKYQGVHQELQSAQKEINDVRSQTQQQINDIQSQAQQERDSLQAEIERLKTFENKNQELETQLHQSQLHVAILSAQNDVVNAQLALEKEDTNSASLALSKTSETLDTISSLLEQNQREVVTAMQDRLDLAVNGIDSNTYAANSDLDVLYNDLIKLENTLYSQP